MYHMFDVEVANEVGIISAVLFQNIAFWCQHSRTNGTNFYDGRYWTYNSIKAFRDTFPYLSKSQIDTSLKKLIDAGLIVKGNYNKSTYDRTAWYALSEIGNALFENQKSISEISEMERREIGNGFPGNRKPIPDIYTDIDTDVNTDKDTIRDRFKRPTIDELTEYANAQHYTGFAPQDFIDYYDSVGWVVGKSRKPMKDWKAAVRQWQSRRRYDKPQANKRDDYYEDIRYSGGMSRDELY